MRDAIVRRLADMEADIGVRVLFAVESGSRAWGFASADSDWDVRFVYARPPPAYLCVGAGDRDVIEWMDDGKELDVSGWDVKKALALFSSTNPPLYEWLGSPIVYRDDGVFAPALRALAPSFFDPRACFHHYLSMANNNERTYLRGPRVRAKKYLYVLRPLLCCEHIAAHGTMPPTPFAALVDAHLADGDARRALDALLRDKAAGSELDDAEPIAPLHAWITDAIARHVAAAPIGRARPDRALLDALLRETLWRLWPDPRQWR